MASDQNPGEITRLVRRALQKDAAAEEKLLDLIYDELRERARHIVPDNVQSLQPTQLVNDAWMRIFHGSALPDFETRTEFYAYAARAMRNLMIDHARRRKPNSVSLDDVVVAYEELAKVDILDLNTALEELADESERQFRTAEMRVFGGMSIRQVAEFHGVSESTARRDWMLAQAKLYRKLRTGFNDE